MTTPALPPLEALLAGMRVVAIPMRVRFRGVTVREAALVRGPSGWGEFSPFLEYGAQESSRWLAAAVEAGWGQWPAARRADIPVNATVPAVSPDEVAGVLARFPGAGTAKVKVAEAGQDLEDDVDRVAAVRDAMGPGGRIRVDANGGWSVAEATDALRRLSAYGLEYAEQPCAQVSELRELRVALARNGIDVLVAADESIRKTEDPARVAREEAADVVVVKVAPLGGVERALEVVADCGLPAVVSSALDTSVGMAAGVALAAALPDLPFACGLGTVALLEGDVCTDPLAPRAGVLPVGRVEPDEALLARWAATTEREQWWRERVAAAHGRLVAP
ncbi:O-succinylbenzoate synthase [Phycicoccus badiiscoriae]|uniref:o-succinylbenzoate synthase n=1 Tax=Pedococcus badiiscoriae TaxID=642776 RepID=A0A852WJL2_9MICO|nr:o-succinylbenzoate synthase [Pedococcus badiiscoriae]NYG06455.1 O-succinylbenzoate synthase [Pedococcus badiiscoriae]